MSTILDGLVRQFGGDIVTQLGQQIGADPATTANAIQIALPILVGGLANNAATPEGATALGTALARDHDGSLLDNLGALLGGSVDGSPGVDGAGILGHILGGRQDTVQDGIQRSTGLDRTQVVRLLIALAPIVMAYLGRHKREEQLDPGGLSDTLQREQQQMETRQPGLGGMLGQLFDQNHDGSVVDDIARAAPGVLGGLFGGRR